LSESTTLELREHFSTPEQQLETAKVGMWIFLVTEIMLFGGLFMAFTVYRMYYPQAFDAGSREMDIVLGSVNTAVLICSSFAMAMADHSAESGNKRLLALFLVLTMVLGCVFLGIKFTEYYKHYQHHEAPGVWFDYSGPNPGKVQMFFVFYFIMTGLHAVHMLIGLGVLSLMLLRTALGTFTARYHTPIQLSGLYWHFVDVVWVFLYAIFYLQGLHK
jgi:cytochrome c oxidase subunit 3